ncbi:MAG: MmgE/PrpD family protein [Acidimicrobiaceae bacterium]|nr:MmgE/PrpD family protein [Acidimicrobiaceae bacterium]MYI34832.1 MmgE/PrpD family protein [Acidimicrobiaceae bacterium]
MADAFSASETLEAIDRSLSAELAEFLSNLEGRIAPERIATAGNCVIDTLGAIAYGSSQPWSMAAARHALATGGGGACTVVGLADRASPAMAAFANGAAAHAFELDDVHEEAVNHPGAVVVPAALAVAEELDASGLTFLEAVVVGYEAMARAGLAVGPVSHMLAGFHPTSMSGVFGAAAAAGHLRRLDAAGLNHALGLATSLASGTMEFASSGGMAKRIHAGRAAEGGIMAAALAAQGFEGAGDGLAGRYGFCRVFTDDPQPQLLTEGLGERWMIDEITVKPYPSCSDLHPMVQATAELVAQHGIRPAEIERLVVHTTTKVVELNDMDGTASVMAAQYSAPFNVAAAVLADPSDPASFSPERIADPALAALQARVTLVLDPAFDATYAWKQGARVEITTTDGRVLERTVHGQRGSMHDPLSDAEIERKFHTLAESRLDPRVPEVVRSLPDRPVRALTRLLRSR